MSDLIQRLAAEFAEFDFFQAVSLLEEYFAASKEGRDPLRSGAIRFRADARITFPPNDISGFEVGEERIELVLAFLGLTGTTSPLPNYFVEFAALDHEKGAALKDFLAMFNHRIYTLFYRAWQKYRFVRMAGAAGFSDTIQLLAGITPDNPGADHARRMSAYAGILAGGNRSAQGLGILIANLFDGIPVTVMQCMPRWVPVADRRPLGRDTALGLNMMLGDRVFDVNGAFRVVIGPLPRSGFEKFLPGAPGSTLLRQFIGSYCVDPLAFDIEVQLQSQELEPVILGIGSAALGKTSALGRSAGRSGIESVIFA
jgi:type VI secretion system protein ImpH